MNQRPKIKYSLLLLAFILLAAVYIFQRINPGSILLDALGFIPAQSEEWIFSINRIIRLMLNDFACIIMIYALFQDVRYVRLGGLVFLIELLIILPIYLILKLSIEGTSEISSPFLSTLHRLIVNPMLMFVLIVGLYLQRLNER